MLSVPGIETPGSRHVSHTRSRWNPRAGTE